MNTREMLEKAITHVIKQGKAATSKEGQCRYRTAEGYMCAVGALINDEFYMDGIESHGIEETCTINVVEKSIGRCLERAEVNFLGEIQESHDFSADALNFVEVFSSRIYSSVGRGHLPDYCLEFIN